MSDPIPLSHLELDLPAPTTGWHAYLADRHIPVELDDVGRLCVSRATARELLAERREAQERHREMADRLDAEREAQRLAQLHPGIPADQVIATGLSPAMAMVATDPDLARRPRRESVLDHALAHEDGIVFHPIRDEEP